MNPIPLCLDGVDRVIGALFGPDDHDELVEDMLVVKVGDFGIDVGWYPEADPTGRYVVRVYEGRFSNQIRQPFESRDSHEVKEYVERLTAQLGAPRNPWMIAPIVWRWVRSVFTSISQSPDVAWVKSDRFDLTSRRAAPRLGTGCDTQILRLLQERVASRDPFASSSEDARVQFFVSDQIPVRAIAYGALGNDRRRESLAVFRPYAFDKTRFVVWVDSSENPAMDESATNILMGDSRCLAPFTASAVSRRLSTKIQIS